MFIIKFYLKKCLSHLLLRPFSLYRWYLKTGCHNPIPAYIKRKLLLRHSVRSATWIETGTYLGETTRFLASRFPVVHTIEPSEYCMSRAKLLTSRSLKRKIVFHLGTSEQKLDHICGQVDGDVCFWLDAHYSAGITFRADEKTPILKELDAIENHMHRYNSITVLIDDVLGAHLDSEYPSIDYYVDWARRNKLLWNIENDVFVAKSMNLPLYMDYAIPK